MAVPVVDPLPGASLGRPQALTASSTDPGSVPDGDLPALVTEEPAGLGPTVQVAAVAVAAVVGFSRHCRVAGGGGGPRRSP